MQIKDLFSKDITREIEGVIKADQISPEALDKEIDEYVMTAEVQERLEVFFEAYNEKHTKNGVWISGFFGSGKSHLLKMLAFLLEGYELSNGTAILDVFLPKCSESLLQGAMRKACSSQAKSLLFNIDQKADTISKSDKDAILKVFLKVFNDECGYYGTVPHVAQFERDLDSLGRYESFKSEYQAIAGKTWEEDRVHHLLRGKLIAQAYSRASGEPIEADIMKQYRETVTISIEDFANMVKAYLDKKPKGFRLNFFVDEVGQFIADNSKLMTNLQTIAESLQTKCGTRSWVIVTAQEDLSTIYGNFSEIQQNDFSKIQDRFSVRMKLSSQNVDEVIQKRLLAKTDAAKERVSALYDVQVHNFQTLFELVNCNEFRQYQGKDDFIQCYPFVPYQFTLFQKSIQKLSEHNAFEGKHSSVGERSMLGVFQEVAKQLIRQQQEVGALAPFDLMFNGISKAVKTAFQNPIIHGQRDWKDGHEFDLRLLKVLFLVKYVTEFFKATPENIAILMRTSFEQKQADLLKQVKDGLSYLERQSYIQNSRGCFEYLTNEERDVENEIKQVSVENKEIHSFLLKNIFQNILEGKSKIRYEKNGHDFYFSRMLDIEPDGAEKELWIHVLSLDSSKGWEQYSSMGISKDELTIVMPQNGTLLQDIQLWLQTDRYCSNSSGGSQSESRQEIINSKRRLNNEREQMIIHQLEDDLSNANIYINAQIYDIRPGGGVINRVKEAFQTLIEMVYPNLRMISRTAYQESDIQKVFTDISPTLVKASLSEEENAVLTMVQILKEKGQNVSVKMVLDVFRKKPYGWYNEAILCQIAKLTMADKLELTLNGEPLSGTAAAESLLNTRLRDNISVQPLKVIAPTTIQNVRRFYQALTDNQPTSTDAIKLGEEIRDAINKYCTLLMDYRNQQSNYPFIENLEPVIELFKQWRNRYPRDYFDQMNDANREELLAAWLETARPIKEFMESPRKDIFDAARQALQKVHENRDYLEQAAYDAVHVIVEDPLCYQGNKIPQLKNLTKQLLDEHASQVSNQQNEAQRKIQQWRDELTSMEDFTRISDEQKAQICNDYDTEANVMNGRTQIASIRDFVHTFETHTFGQLKTKVYNLAHPQPEKRPQKQFVQMKNLVPNFSKTHLETEADVKAYIAALTKVLMEQIQFGHVIEK